jgi:1-acyl-sn-glycerol-3-phosphate acyltransferase
MPYALLFAAVSLAGTAALCRFAALPLGWALPVFLLCFVLMHPLYLALYWLLSQPCDRSRPIERQNPRSRRCCVGIASFLTFYAGIRTELRGAEKLPRDRRFLYVSNHRSFYDPLIVISSLKEENISFVSKPSNMNLPLAGTVAYAAGYLAIDRENDRKALKTILAAADYLKRGVCSMAIYPEGTRSRTGELLPFHAGSFKIAQRASAPLVVAVVRGSDRVKRRLFLRPTKVELEILEVLPPEQVKAMSTHELAEHSRALMEQALEN